MRRAFGLWQAMMIMLLIGGIMTVALRYARVGAVHTADSYVREQAELFMQSSIEIALLQISGHDRSGGCMDHLHIVSRDRRFVADINITGYYLLEGSGDAALCGPLTRPITTEESHGMVQMAVAVATNPAAGHFIHPVRLLRRTLQRP